MHPHVTTITLTVEDLERAAGFYERLGLQVDRRTKLTMVALEGQALALCPVHVLAQEIGAAYITRACLSHHVTSQGEVEEWCERAIEAGGVALRGPQHTSWGGYSGWFADPDGHLWEIVHRPPKEA